MVRAELVAASPEECGVDAAALDALFKRAEEELTRGGLEGCQVAIARHGKLAGVRSFPEGDAATSSAAQTGHRFPWHIHSTSSSSQNRCSQAVCTGASSTPWQMEQSRCRLTLLPSTKQLSSRPMAAAPPFVLTAR